ncbi:MAG TPA: tetratricopeptide repeat protein [Bacteroidales bacterium]|nr:tetratricopeptide repeat protein [Bacteroidales bacterium]
MKKTSKKSTLTPKEKNKKKQPGSQRYKKNKYFNILGLAIIVVLGILIYSNSFKGSFYFDDNIHIVDNSKIRNLNDVKTWWNYSPNRPISMFSFVLNYHFNQLDAWYYHLVNLIIHLINGLLVWWLTLLLFSAPGLKDNPAGKHKYILAFGTAVFFVSHPLATQSVTYIIQRQNSMAALFYFLSLALYMKARMSDRENRIRYLMFSGSLISAILAVLSKENAYTLPFTIVLFEFCFFRTRKTSLKISDSRTILLFAAFFGIILLALFKFSLNVLHPIYPNNGNVYTVTPQSYLFTQFSVIVKYLQLLIFPVRQNLDYDYPISLNFFELRTLLSFLLLLTLFVLAIFLYKKHRIFSFGIFWFFLTLSIESSFIPIADLIYEHRTYLPSFGFFLIVTNGIYVLLWNKYKVPAVILWGMIVISSSFMTFQRNKIWKDDLTLWNDVALKSPEKARPFLCRGFAYNNLGQIEKAIADYSKAIENDPAYTDAYYNRGVSYGNLGQWEKAIADLTRVIELDPKSVMAYSNRSVAYGNLGQYDKSISDNSKVIEINPHFAVAYYNRGYTYRMVGQWDKAIADLSKSIELDPAYAVAYYNRGVAYMNIGQADKAFDDFTKIIELDPNYGLAYNYRGEIYMQRGKVKKAIEDFNKALEVDPNCLQAKQNRDVAYKKINMNKTLLQLTQTSPAGAY